MKRWSLEKHTDKWIHLHVQEILVYLLSETNCVNKINSRIPSAYLPALHQSAEHLLYQKNELGWAYFKHSQNLTKISNA